MRSFSYVKLTKKAFLREEGGPLAVEGALRYNIKKPIFIVTHSPSVDFVDSSLPEGAFLTTTFFASLLFALSSSAIASFEVRDYRVVFVIRKTAFPKKGGIFMLFLILRIPRRGFRG